MAEQGVAVAVATDLQGTISAEMASECLSLRPFIDVLFADTGSGPAAASWVAKKAPKRPGVIAWCAVEPKKAAG